MKAIKTDLSGSLFYEVFLGLVSHGKEIGRTCIQLKASSPFLAAVKAEDTIDHRYYGEYVISRTLRVSQITEDEFLYIQAA
jgi:hypothetical protein